MIEGRRMNGLLNSNILITNVLTLLNRLHGTIVRVKFLSEGKGLRLPSDQSDFKWRGLDIVIHYMRLLLIMVQSNEETSPTTLKRF